MSQCDSSGLLLYGYLGLFKTVEIRVISNCGELATFQKRLFQYVTWNL